MKRNLVLTVAIDYPLAKLRVFLASFAAHVGTAELAILARGCDDAFYEAAAAMGAIVVDAVPQRPYAVMGARHFLYRDFLRANRRNFDAVLLSDARDVAFQGDPFTRARDYPVLVAAEEHPIGRCPFNRWWITTNYGEGVADELADEIISCAGTTIGSIDGILRYLDLMCGELDAHAETIQEAGDQGFHNYILHRLRPDFIGLDQASRVMKTIGYTLPQRIRIEGDEVLVDSAATAPVIHQWDRKPELLKHFNARYAS